MKKDLRFGYTTGTCAAAAAAAALIALFTRRCPEEVEIGLPDGRRVALPLATCAYRERGPQGYASVIKDAGDDPDITNGAEIAATAAFSLLTPGDDPVGPTIRGGPGIGLVTKPGLCVSVGEPAINPVPRQMIERAVREVCAKHNDAHASSLEITISAPRGEELAARTLNRRLGILGGISILGTTGIVTPVSSLAWKATISSSLSVAHAVGVRQIVLSTGRASEKAHMRQFNLPEESYVMMGDYLEFALLNAARVPFHTIHLCAQWAKMLKIAQATPNTHVQHGAIDLKGTLDFLRGLGIAVGGPAEFNTAREIFHAIAASLSAPQGAFSRVCQAAQEYARSLTSGVPVVVHLVSYEGEVITSRE
ncbi:MAG TPA: cobalt-precorrin-5B (C(1))-methyltransferase [Syntrophorhabdaceae bacterium]|nr:cobalt-precorrin-5B (C(1))-methyltransferase [Syntrophorhabdaceae bacterium]